MPTPCPHPNPLLPGDRTHPSEVPLTARSQPELLRNRSQGSATFRSSSSRSFNRTYEELSPASRTARGSTGSRRRSSSSCRRAMGATCAPRAPMSTSASTSTTAPARSAGLAGVNVHDIPVGKDCQGDKTHPLAYVCGVDHQPRRDWCGAPVSPRVRAILVGIRAAAGAARVATAVGQPARVQRADPAAPHHPGGHPTTTIHRTSWSSSTSRRPS